MSERYRRVGRRYFPVWDKSPYESWESGSYLITISRKPGSKTTTSANVTKVNQKKLGLMAAAQALQNRLVDIIYDANKLHVRNPITPAQRKAWDALEKSGVNTLYQRSASEVAERVLAAIVENAE